LGRGEKKKREGMIVGGGGARKGREGRKERELDGVGRNLVSLA
jgi:hypothetical protein